MNEIKCCEKFNMAIENEEFITSLILDDNTTYYIRGKPNLVDDGNDCFDDMTDETQILFCPFCGKKL